MGERELFSPYPSCDIDFIIDGKVRGQHFIRRLTGLLGGTLYAARVDIHGRLPLLCLSPGTGLDLKEERRGFGPLLPTGIDKVDELFQVRSDGWGFPQALLSEPGLLVELALLKHRVQGIELRPDGAQTMLCVDLRIDRGLKELNQHTSFVRALFAAVERIVQSGRSFPDAHEVLTGARKDLDPSPEQVNALIKHVTDATHWVVGTVHRADKRIEGRLRLEELGEPLLGTIHVFWRDEDLSSVDISFEGRLPEGTLDDNWGDARLIPQSGFGGFLQSLGELTVGDAPLDDAFVIRANGGAQRLLLNAREHLLALGRYGAQLQFENDTLKAQLAEVEYDPADLARLINTLLELWRRTALFCAGLQDAPTDPTALP